MFTSLQGVNDEAISLFKLKTNQCWIMDGDKGEFMTIGVFNQHIYINPAMNTVIVKNSVNKNYYDVNNPYASTEIHLGLYRKLAHMNDYKLATNKVKGLLKTRHIQTVKRTIKLNEIQSNSNPLITPDNSFLKPKSKFLFCTSQNKRN